jgi:hypothetical protein
MYIHDFLFFCIIVCSAITGCVCGTGEATRTLQAKAIQTGNAEWVVVNENNGLSEFRWIDHSEKTDKTLTKDAE